MTDAERQRLAGILGMLGSDHAGERAAAGLQAEAFRKKHGLTWPELLGIPTVAAMPEPDHPPPPPPTTPERPTWVPKEANTTPEDRAWMAFGCLSAGGLVALLLTILTHGIPRVLH
ncbi:MAG TPA: hypothetical protein VGH84_13060 [Steroidobacteraceae bacterium]|jgi:hypothetical protein